MSDITFGICYWILNLTHIGYNGIISWNWWLRWGNELLLWRAPQFICTQTWSLTSTVKPNYTCWFANTKQRDPSKWAHSIGKAHTVFSYGLWLQNQSTRFDACDWFRWLHGLEREMETLGINVQVKRSVIYMAVHCI